MPKMLYAKIPIAQTPYSPQNQLVKYITGYHVKLALLSVKHLNNK